MQDANIQQALTEIFHDLFGDSRIVLRRDLSARDVKGWDSIKHISLIVAVEERFGIKLKTAEIDRLNNVGDLEDAISARTTR